MSPEIDKLEKNKTTYLMKLMVSDGRSKIIGVTGNTSGCKDICTFQQESFKGPSADCRVSHNLILGHPDVQAIWTELPHPPT